MKKKIVLSLLALVLVLAVIPLLSNKAEAATVASGTCGTSVTWTLDDKGTLTISGTGAMKDYTIWSGGPWYNNRTSIKTIMIEDGVTSIGSYAFYGCTRLTSVTIPSSVTSIGNYAFGSCSSLTSVTIPSSVTSIGDYAFYYCSSLTSVTIPSSVKSIGEGTFYVCSSLTSVTIPSSVTSIGSNAFNGCSSLTSVTIPEGVTSIGSYAFYWCSSLTSVTIPSSVTSIGSNAFDFCSSLTSVTISEGVTSIGSYAFTGCDSLTSVTIPSSVTSIGNYAFSNCLDLTSVTILEGVTSIGSYAFYVCRSLTSVTIPPSVTSIGDHAFTGCDSLTSVTIPSSVTSIGSYAFYDCSSLTEIFVENGNSYFTSVDGVLFNKDKTTLVCFPGGKSGEYVVPASVTSIGGSAFRLCRSLTSVTIPSSVTSIGDHAFDSCSSLTSVTIPEGVTSIGSYAFYECSSLTSVTILEGVTSIGNYAFCECRGLTSVTIPEGVTSIGSNAFYWCSSLTEITFEGNAPSIGRTAFFYVTATAYYPAGDASYTAAVMQNYGGTLTWVEKQLGCKHANTENHNEQAATCKDVGYTAGVYCTDCEQYISGHDEIPVSNVHSYGAWVKIDGNQHSKTCAVCEDVVTENHEWNNGDVTTDQTHFADGEKTFTCAKCGATKTEVLTMIAHTFDQQKAEQDYFATEASCTQKATYYYSCICGAKGTDVFEFGKIAEHSFSIYQYNNDATCHKDGTETSKCDFCDATDTRTKQGSRTEHIEDDAWHTNENGHYHICKKCESALEVLKHTPGAEATCTTDQICTVCRTVLVEKLGHQLNDVQFDEDCHWKVCQRCEEKTDVKKHDFTLNWNNNLAVHTCECGFFVEEKTSNTIESMGNESLELSPDVLTNISGTEAGTLQIDFGGGLTVTYDKDAVASIAEAIGSENVVLVAGKVELNASGLSQKQMQALEGVAKDSALFSITLETNNGVIHNFNGGKATISVPFGLPADWNEDAVKVYRVEEDGTKTPMETRYEDGVVTWVTDGHSYYLVTQAEENESAGLPAWIFAVAGTAVVAVAAIAFAALKKKKQ